MKETIAPNQNQPGLADGKYRIQFTGTEKFNQKDTDKPYRRWAGIILKVIESEVEPLTPNFEFVLPPFKYQELAIALGGVKQPNGSVDWDDETVPGKIVELEIFHTEYKGKLYLDMKNIKLIGKEAQVPF